MTEKIQKLLSRLGYGSRRSIEEMIKCGNIFINSKKAIIGQRLSTKNPGKIVIKNQLIDVKEQLFQPKVLIYNKPEGEICTTVDNYSRPTVFDNLPLLKKSKWINIGRLDLNTRGLLLFTNDGNLANKLMHPKNEIEREYYIRIFGSINTDTMKKLHNIIKIHNTIFKFKKIIALNNTLKKNIWFKAILCEGKNREIRKIFNFFNCQVNRLIRVRYGNIVLPKNLKTGNFIELHSILVHNLYKLIAKSS